MRVFTMNLPCPPWMLVPTNIICGNSVTGPIVRSPAVEAYSIVSLYVMKTEEVRIDFHWFQRHFRNSGGIHVALSFFAVTSDIELCWAFAKNPRPLRQTKRCNSSPCPAHWLTGPWQFCPVTCRNPDLPPPIRRRSVMCLDQHEVVQDDEKCNPSTRPIDADYCESNLPDCSIREKLRNRFS